MSLTKLMRCLTWVFLTMLKLLFLGNVKDLKTDSSNVAAINGSDTCISWEHLTIIRDIQFYLSSFRSWKVRHVITECNSPADTLAKHSRRFRISNELYYWGYWLFYFGEPQNG